MSGLTLLMVIFGGMVLLVASVGLLLLCSIRVYVASHLALVPSDTFVSPCEVVALHLAIHGRGFYGNPMADTVFLRSQFLLLENKGQLVGMPRYGGQCGCPRVFKLSPSETLRREREKQYPIVAAVSNRS